MLQLVAQLQAVWKQQHHVYLLYLKKRNNPLFYSTSADKDSRKTTCKKSTCTLTQSVQMIVKFKLNWSLVINIPHHLYKLTINLKNACFQKYEYIYVLFNWNFQDFLEKNNKYIKIKIKISNNLIKNIFFIYTSIPWHFCQTCQCTKCLPQRAVDLSSRSQVYLNEIERKLLILRLIPQIFITLHHIYSKICVHTIFLFITKIWYIHLVIITPVIITSS